MAAGWLCSHHASPAALGAVEVLHAAVGVGGGLLAASAPLTCHSTHNHGLLGAESDAHAAWVLPLRQSETVLLDAVEAVLGLGHEGRVRDRVPDVARMLVVQNGRLLLTWHLDALQRALVTAREGHFVTVHDDVFVTLEEVLLEAPSVDHRWAQVHVLWVQTSINSVVVA